MIFTKTSFYKKHRAPIDGGKYLRGKRIFGDNKTWIGFGSMIVISSIVHVIWGWAIDKLDLTYKSDYYNIKKNSISYNFILGILNGFLYMISELPNSFMKRRLGIESDKRVKGIKGIVSFIVDQVDSIIGICVMIKELSGCTWKRCIEFIGLGSITHLGVNVVLYKLHLRRSL